MMLTCYASCAFATPSFGILRTVLQHRLLALSRFFEKNSKHDHLNEESMCEKQEIYASLKKFEIKKERTPRGSSGLNERITGYCAARIVRFRFFFWRKGRKRKSLAKRKAPKGVFRPLRRARRAPRPPPRKLLKKFDQNFYPTDESRYVARIF